MGVNWHGNTRRILRRIKYIWLAGVVLGLASTTLYVVTQHNARGVPTLLFITALFGCGYMTYGSYAEGYDAGRDVTVTEAKRNAQMAIDDHRQREAEARKPCTITFDDIETWPDEGHIYILKFSTGVIKVGQTLDLVRRMREHRRDAEAFGAVIVDYWFSPAHHNYLENEVEMILRCDEVATWRSKREYFQGLDIDEVIAFASELTYYTASLLSPKEVKA